VQVNLLVQNNQIHLKIQDNGKGFDLKKVAQKKTLGILGMKERTLLMQGECIISSKPEMGTLIELIIPLNITID
jgi:signal transduction histidine kinase